MNSRKFGRLGWPVSEIGYGLWGLGGWWGSNAAASPASLERSLALGCTFSTPRCARQWQERATWQVLPRHRDKTLRIATKVPLKNLRWPAKAEYPLADVFPADHIRQCTETSLANLGLQSLDLQQFHVWSDAWAEDDRWQRAIDDLKREGLIRGFGISINRWQPDSVLKAISTGVVDSVQVVYNIFDQSPEDELFPKCRELGVAVIARVPFDEGSLAGALERGMTWPEGDWRNIYFTPEKLDDPRPVEAVRMTSRAASLPDAHCASSCRADVTRRFWDAPRRT